MPTLSKPKASEFQTGSLQFSEWGAVEELFARQKAYFKTDATKTYECRVDQLDPFVVQSERRPGNNKVRKLPGSTKTPPKK